MATKLGLALLALGFVLPMLFYGKSLCLYRSLNADSPSSEYLEKLRSIKERDRRMQNAGLNWYFCLVSLGFAFYIYEYTLARSLAVGLLSYAALAAWTLTNWLVLRPMAAERRNRKFTAFISMVEGCILQIEGNGSGDEA